MPSLRAARRPSPDVLDGCGQQGERVSVPPYVVDWCGYPSRYGGRISNTRVAPSGNTLPAMPHRS
ncbi:hypothetical protein C5F59_037885 [Streptomyces sp. QL37]|uniref:hypothetical protein n=1 Tax=Streptomyces sp. QL37 TaxID=2093747 RepID=UPI000CF25AED|nr:hypothetical protein [Streptomyces sp. QL37]PPQ61890.1 hypothetical protein C5F59_38395 [Streptomyces sp. QL37]